MSSPDPTPIFYGDARDDLLASSADKQSNALAHFKGKESLWFLSVSSKLYSATYNDMDNDDFRSTKPSMFYSKKDGTKNKNCCRVRKRWEATLEKKKDVFQRCLRIHVCLPEVKRADKDQERIFIDQDDNSIVLYITSENVHKIFRNDSLGILRQLGCLKDEP